MKNYFIIASILLQVFACKQKSNYDVNDFDFGQFVKITSKENKVWVLEYGCLNSVTPAVIEDLSIGLSERMDIISGKRKLLNSTIENLDCMSFDLPQNLDKFHSFLELVKNNDSIDINTLPQPQQSIYIKELIERDFIVTFDDYEGMFYVKK
jgi:hypothetical protein